MLCNPLPLTLPLDIWGEIVQHVYFEGDMDTLRSLSLCCRALLPFCQRELFYSVLIPERVPEHATERDARIQELHQILSQSPHISNYVRIFTFFIALADVNNPIIREIVARFTRIRFLELDHRDTTTNRLLDWDLFDEGFKGAFKDIIQLPHLESLDLATFTNVPTSTFLDLSQELEIINLNEVELKDDLKSPTPGLLRASRSGRIPQPSLITAMNGCGDIISLLLNATPQLVDFTKLDYIGIGWDKENIVAVVSRMLKAAPALEFLSCRGTNGTTIPFRGLANAISAANLKSLEQLEVMPALTVLNTGPSDDLLWGLRDEVALLATKSKLKKFNIRFELYGSHFGLPTKLGELDSLFETKNFFPTLRKLSIQILVLVEDTRTVHERHTLRTELEQGCYDECRRIQRTPGLVFDCDVSVETVHLG
ncbi:unnamed protein product [Cyclocybe aegerita]|uniref:F-box domain-containing protein n=1 Tax=Cyclocybe aegerita TaxID=1973307 RepID=A0A8S0XSX7_CYCAE|nr:unnamed protein product [Cyclocybe aegerita]